MRTDIKEYEAVESAALKFVKSVAEGIVNMQGNYLSTRPFYSDTWTASWSTET